MLDKTDVLSFTKKEEISQILLKQREYFESGVTLNISHRINALKKLKKVLEAKTKDIQDALYKDFKKSEFESYVLEIGVVLTELEHTIKKIKSWSRPKKVFTPLVHWPARSEIHNEPYGNTLIIGPWNYPFLLILSPVIGAIAAGNTCVIKPSEVSAHTAKIIEDIIAMAFGPGYVDVVQGAIDETNWLLDSKFDYIFYTGNSFVGKIIMEKASKYLTPVTLELGGKSPCVILGDVNMELTCKRVAWGKFINAGQTCVAPDYVLVEKSKKKQFIEQMQKVLADFSKNKDDNTRIINERHFERITGYLEESSIKVDVDKQDNFIPTTLVEAKQEDKVMSEEIFGPILPIIEIENATDAVKFINKRDKPLALYVFTKNTSDRDIIIRETSSGAVLVNDTILHLSNMNLPFGGVGQSGMGAYHGKFSFDTFSHKKPVMKRSFWFDIPLRYPPYAGKLNMIKKLFKFLA